MDGIGGLQKLVGGKTVGVKVNLVGDVKQDFGGKPANRTYQVHPTVVLALASLLDRAGARRVRFLESTHQTEPFEKYLKTAGWDLSALTAFKTPVEFEDTRNLGQGKKYHEVKVPWGGSLYPSYDLNHSYVDCDVYVSLAKMKNHATAGVTLGMKNNFGVTPIALYGQPEQKEDSTNARVAIFHARWGAEEAPRRPAEGGRQSPGRAAPAALPGPPAHGRRGRHPADRPGDRRRDRGSRSRRGEEALAQEASWRFRSRGS